MDKPLPDDFDPYEFNMTAISGGNGNGGRQWLMQLLQGLILAGIVGLFGVVWSMKSDITELRATQYERGRSYDRDFQRIDSTIARHDQRITDLERGEGSNQSDPNHRQKRR